jgi:hypothetical protein
LLSLPWLENVWLSLNLAFQHGDRLPGEHSRRCERERSQKIILKYDKNKNNKWLEEKIEIIRDKRADWRLRFISCRYTSTQTWLAVLLTLLTTIESLWDNLYILQSLRLY